MLRATPTKKCSPRLTRLILALSALSCTLSSPARAANYVFSTFKGDLGPQEKLSIYTSDDALNFTLLSDTGFSGTSGTLRDPSIMKYKDGKYYVAYTNPPTASCCGKADHFSIASSTDLKTWSALTTVASGVPGVAHTWAPEWFIDGTTVNVIANIDTLNTDSDFKPYVFTAKDSSLTTWSGPVPLGIGPNYIDAFVMKLGATYHVFAKNELPRFVEHATASSLTGPWKFVGTGDWAGWGSGMEGPNVVQLPDGSFRIFLDAQGSNGFLYANSPDLMTWSKTQPLPAVTQVVRHGTVIRDVPLGAGGAANGGAGGGPAATAGGAGDSGNGGAIAGTSGAGASGAGAGNAGDTSSLAGASSGGALGVAGSALNSGAAGAVAAGGVAGLGSNAAGGASVSAGTQAGAAAPADAPSGCSCELVAQGGPTPHHGPWLSAWLALSALGLRKQRARRVNDSSRPSA